MATTDAAASTGNEPKMNESQEKQSHQPEHTSDHRSGVAFACHKRIVGQGKTGHKESQPPEQGDESSQNCFEWPRVKHTASGGSWQGGAFAEVQLGGG